MSTFFISHSSKDNEAAAMLRERLEGRGYKSLFLDFDPADGIPVGQSWERTLYHKLRACDVVLVLFSENHRDSNWCFAEIALARMEGKHVITLLIEPFKGVSIPSILTEQQYLDLRGGTDDSAFENLWRGLAALGVSDETDRRWDPKRSPYPGMLAFTESEAPVFFGRSEETRQIAELLNANKRRDSDHFLTILGASGSGKSSIVRAGVIPKLRNDPQWWVIGPFRPGRGPLDELAERLSRAFGRSPEQIPTLIEELRRSSIPDVIERLRRRSDRPDATPLVVIDQFEELLDPNDADATAFLKMLDATCSSDKLAIHIVATLRSDFMAELQSRRDLPGLQRASKSFTVTMVARGALRSMITQPARLCALELEEGLVDRLLEETGTPDALPLLAFGLRLLWDRGHEDDRLTIGEYEALGGLGHMLALEADAVLDAIRRDDPGAYAQLPAAFVRMSRLSESSGFARVMCDWKDHPPSVHEALNCFVRKRILTSRHEDGADTVEIAHEALFRSWSPLAKWLDEQMEVLKLNQVLRDNFRRWKQDADDADLLRGTRLSRVKELETEKRITLNAQEKKFVERSVVAEKDRLLKEGNVIGAVLGDERLRSLLEPRLKPVIDELLAEERKLAAASPFSNMDDDVIPLTETVQAMENIALPKPRWHPQKPEVTGNTGARDNYQDVFTFPCCGLRRVGGASLSQFRADGCQVYDPKDDAPARSGRDR